MDGYQFIADLIRSLTSVAWTVAIIVIVYMFKDPLTELLPNLNISYNDFKLSLRQAEQKAEALPEPQEPPPQAEDNEFDKLLKISPAAAVVHVRRKLETSLTTYAQRRGLTRIPLGLHRLSRELLKQDLIDAPTAEVLSDVARTAAAASHSSSESISASDAQRVRDVAERVMRGLDVLGAAATMPPPGPVVQN